ncbi:hypothetical protein ACSQ67_024357 [Phaseolus vulgaris]
MVRETRNVWKPKEQQKKVSYARLLFRAGGHGSEVEEGELGGVFVIRWLSISVKVLERKRVKTKAIRGKACTAVQLQEVVDFQESLRGAVNVVGPLENIPCRIEGVGNWHVGLNKERKLVEKVVGENNSLMSGGVGNGLGERLRRNVARAGSLDRLGVSCGSGRVHEREHSGMWEFANNVPVGLRGGNEEAKAWPGRRWWALQVSSSDERVACDGGSGDGGWRLWCPRVSTRVVSAGRGD